MPNIAHLRLPHPDADPERAWLETTTLDLRRLVPGEAAGARDSLSIDADADDGDDVDVAFLEAVLPHRPKQNVPSSAAAVKTAAALPPLPALPIGSRLLPIGEIVSWRTNKNKASHPLCCASDLGALWSDARAAARDAKHSRECQKENQNQTSADPGSSKVPLPSREGTGATSPASFATKDVTVPKLACLETVPAASARKNALAPVVPFAVVGRLRLARADARPNDETEDPKPETEDDWSATGLCLEDTTGCVAVASVDLPDARLLGKRVLCVAWTLLIDGAPTSRARDGGGARRGALLEAARFAPLDAPSVVAVPLPAITNAAVPAPPPPRRGGGFGVRGAVTAVSPLIGLTVPSGAEGGAKGSTHARHTFFLVELSGDACASCGVPNDGTENTGAQSVNDVDTVNDAWRRRLVFTGDALARWRPFFGAAMGGENGASGASGSDATRRCGCVLVANLRASRLFKGEGDRRELRVAAATAATTVTPVCARDDEGAMTRRAFELSAGDATSPETGGRGCSCASCARGDTVSRLDVHVLSEDPSGLGVRVSGRRDGCGVPFLLTHALIGSPRRDGVTFPALRPGCLVRVTHAHPVWRRGADADESVDEDEPDETDEDDYEDDMVSEEEPYRPQVKVRNDETDHFGLRALGACVRTRVRVLRRSPLAAFAPRLFAADDAVSSRSRWSFFRASLASARATQRHCETRSFVDTAHTRRLALALARRTRTTDANDGRDDQTRPNNAFSDFSDLRERVSFRSSDGSDDGNARAARAAFAGLLLGKRKRHGENLIAGQEHDDSTSFRRQEQELPSKQFHDALAAAFSDFEDRDFGDERPRVSSARSPATTETKTETGLKTENPNESARASIYHEFFAPISLGGLEARVPRLPAVSAVLREASRAFAEASAAKKTRRVAARADGTAPARGTETETERDERVPFGASVGAARCDRLVVSGAALFAKRREPSRDPSREGEAPPPKPPKPVALVGWLAHRARDAGARLALELSDAPFASSAGDYSYSRARGGRVHVEIEDASVSVAETLPLGVLVVLRRWTVFCEGASLCVADDPRDPKPAPCRVHVRVRREDLAVIGAAAPGGFGEHALAPPPPATCGVSDVLVWSPDRSPLGGDAPPPEPGPGGVPLALSRGATAPPPGAGSEPPPRANAGSRPPAPWFPPPFLARVTRDERILDDRGGERKLRLTLADTTNAHDVVDAYVGGMDPRRVPPGVGGGAVVLVSRAAAHVSASANVYLKLTSRTVLRVIAPAASTLELTRLSCFSSFFKNEQKHRGPEASRKRFATLDALARGATAGFALGRVDRRRWTTRARVARVSFLCAKWACLSCGCDAGSFGAADAAAAMRLVARRRAERSKVGFTKDDKNDDVFAQQTVPPSDFSVAGCAACRPPAERFRDDAALARAVDAACGFEVEVGAVLTNGEAAADCWVAGGAGKAALPGSVLAATRALAKKHGRVVARFDAAAAAAGSPSPYATEGYCGRALGETERAPLLAAVGHAASLGEVLATVEYKYGVFLNDETTERGGVAAALSSPGPVTRLMSLGGVPVATAVAPTAKLRAVALEPVEPAREAARMLAEEAEVTSEKEPLE